LGFNAVVTVFKEAVSRFLFNSHPTK